MRAEKKRSLPTEIWDRIWLLCDENTLKGTRELQSEYVKKTTEFFTFTQAAKNGNLKNMKWLKENNCPLYIGTFREAANNGDLETMKWLKENNCPWDGWTFSVAEENGDLETMKWLKENLTYIPQKKWWQFWKKFK
ncbi:hypothetical protein HK103_004034 [Boothiomyces macroporosus]|uniref:Ankyrin repeat protein n=1 Tax=Boothiomyces macroporosus TaxID=261099 RepID=A0AAD5UCJ2_9FUNG|nr:hypothetical protein HK103_004034 [Boothiomyces macroporosus]